MKSFRFITTCVNSTYELLDVMGDHEIQITWRTFLKHVPITEVKNLFPGYSYRGETYNPDTGELTIGFHIKDDIGVSFHRSVYDGVRCYYLVWSAIEFIFV